MKTYIKNEDGSFSINGSHIPNDTNNRHYKQAIEEVENGSAEAVDYVAPIIEKTPREKAFDIMSSQPIAVRSEFASIWSSVNNALDIGDSELAIYLINSANVSEELEPVKQEILSAFGA